MKKTLLIAGLATVTLFACKKDDDNATTNMDDFKTTEKKSLTDFVDIVAVPQYTALSAKADALNAAVVALNTNASEANLTSAKNAWTDMRAVWEQCEGFLFGPVEDDEYDGNMDTWPTDYVQMDSLLNSNATLSASTLSTINRSMRGFHPLEYILFGTDGARAASTITSRQKEYMVTLAGDLQNNCQALANSWAANGSNYAGLVKTAGYGSSKYTSRLEMFQAITSGLVAICEEVGTAKMQDPLGLTVANADSNLVESPYSGNSVTDFRNNIIGLQNVYLSRYGSATGKSFSDVVRFNNQALDNKIRTEITAAINSFSTITVSYEQAIYTQRTQIQNTQAALATLQATLDGELNEYIVKFVKD